MKFADYFKEALDYGEALGFRNGSQREYADISVELDGPKQIKLKDGCPFYPSFLTVWEASGINTDSIDPIKPEITVEQQLKLIKMCVSAYEKYLADKKEPVAADSAE